MASIGQSTVEGFNTFLNEQKNAEGEAYMTLVQFDDRYEENYKNLPINQAGELVLGENFIPRGSTALFDAIGKTIEDLHKELEGDDVIFVIITDGHENASRTYTREAVMKMIETKEKEGWSFLFLAANQDAIQSGGSIGIKGSNAMTFGTDAASVTNSYMSVSANIKSYRNAKFKDQSVTMDAFGFTEEQRKESNKNK